MESRFIIAYALCGAMVLIAGVIAARYRSQRKQFKLRQSGRGKSGATVPAE